MEYKKVIIYYFTGTGNARQVAQWIHDSASEKIMECEIVNIAKTKVSTMPEPPGDSLLILVSPVHGFNYPPVMLHFIAQFPKGKNNVFLMNTRAGMRIGSLVTPGLTGITFILASVFLLFKGYKIRGALPVDLPSNWISVHPGLNDSAILFLHQRMENRVKKYSQKMLKGQFGFPFFYEIIPDLLIAPVALAYYIVGRFFFAKTFIASRDCNYCNLCVASCPVKAIKLLENRLYWTFKCESCMRCMSNCPQKAIETAHGSTAAFVLLLSLLGLPAFYKGIEYFFLEINNGFMRFTTETILFLLSLWIWYRLVHYLMRFKFFERIVVFTSLTKFKFWGRRYKSINTKYF